MWHFTLRRFLLRITRWMLFLTASGHHGIQNDASHRVTDAQHLAICRIGVQLHILHLCTRIYTSAYKDVTCLFSPSFWLFQKNNNVKHFKRSLEEGQWLTGAENKATPYRCWYILFKVIVKIPIILWDKLNYFGDITHSRIQPFLQETIIHYKWGFFWPNLLPTSASKLNQTLC